VSATTGVTVVDLGAFPGTGDASIAVVAPGIPANAIVNAWLVGRASADHSADEHRLENLRVTAGDVVAGTGFTVSVMSTMKGQYGAWSIGWSWQAATV
jgi:hypothetical protein